MLDSITLESVAYAELDTLFVFPRLLLGYKIVDEL